MTMNKKIKRSLLLFTLINIFLLATTSLADSYLIHKSDPLVEDQKIEVHKDFIKTLVNSGLNLLIGFLSVKQIGSVSAEEVKMKCCTKTKNNALCMDVLSTNADECAVPLVETECKYTPECRYGCCIDSIEGTCSTNSPKKKCEQEGGTWKSDKDCIFTECQKGCCDLNNDYKFITQQECIVLSGLRGIETNFRSDINLEQNCMALRQTSEDGACLFDGKCTIKNGRDCVNSGGNFASEKFCSDPELEAMYNYDYKYHDHFGCVEGKEDIYWFDSQNNIEDIYKNCKDNKETCTLNSGGAACKSTDCNDPVKTKDFFERYGRYPHTGESWCIYDGIIGDGKDSAGSEHWKAECVLGEINEGKSYLLCGSQRGEICTESKIEYNNGNDFFVTGNCVINEASKCIEYNDDYKDNEQKLKGECEKNKQCQFNQLWVGSVGDTDNWIRLCSPKYPKGADLSDGLDDNLCSIASLSLPVMYKKSTSVSGWGCIGNCDIETSEFFEKMNNLCMSLGDCGTSVNYIGDGTNNFYYIPKRGYKLNDDGTENKDEESDYSGCDTGGAGDHANCQNPSWKDNTRYSIVDYDNVASPQDLGSLASQILGENINTADIDEADINKINKYLGIIPGAIAGTTLILAEAGAFGALEGGLNLPFGLYSAHLGSVGIAIFGIGMGMVVGHFVAKVFGVSGPAATASTLGGGLSGGTLALGANPLAIASVGAILFWAGVAIIITSILLGGPDYETRYVEFSCNPWTPPLGGENCEKCNDNSMKPCTEYRCQSLGTMCEFLNDDSENPPCVSMEPENIAPEISPGNLITSGYEFKTTGLSSGADVKIQKRNGGCIPQGNSIEFSVNTNENAQCKWSTQQPKDPRYSEMEGSYTSEGTRWAINHTISFIAPRVDSLDSDQITGSIPNRKGNIKIYIKCQDYQDPPNFNPDNYVIDICVDEKDTDPVDYSFTTFNPKDGSYIPYGSTEKDIKMWINEPAECKYDTNPGISYENMIYNFNCDTNLKDKTFFGWLCTTTLKNLLTDTNKIYIKCKDQPWFTGENEIKRNINNEDMEYTLYGSSEELTIDSIMFTYGSGEEAQMISSEETFKVGIEPISVEMEVRTSGGANKGISTCSWGVIENGDKWEFYDTNARIHTQILTPRFNGTYFNYIYCEDEGKNNATGSASFSIDVNTEPPIIVRVYHQDSYLKIITNEEAKCYYSPTTCNFNIRNATLMRNEGYAMGYSTEHSTDWNIRKTYYIKCQDIYGIINSECFVVRPLG